MHQFLDSDARPTERRTLVRAAGAYVEIQSHGTGSHGGITYTYVTRGEAPGSFIVATCWGRDFDQLSDARQAGLRWKGPFRCLRGWRQPRIP